MTEEELDVIESAIEWWSRELLLGSPAPDAAAALAGACERLHRARHEEEMAIREAKP